MRNVPAAARVKIESPMARIRRERDGLRRAIAFVLANIDGQAPGHVLTAVILTAALKGEFPP